MIDLHPELRAVLRAGLGPGLQPREVALVFDDDVAGSPSALRSIMTLPVMSRPAPPSAQRS